MRETAVRVRQHLRQEVVSSQEHGFKINRWGGGGVGEGQTTIYGRSVFHGGYVESTPTFSPAPIQQPAWWPPHRRPSCPCRPLLVASLHLLLLLLAAAAAALLSPPRRRRLVVLPLPPPPSPPPLPPLPARRTTPGSRPRRRTRAPPTTPARDPAVPRRLPPVGIVSRSRRGKCCCTRRG